MVAGQDASFPGRFILLASLGITGRFTRGTFANYTPPPLLRNLILNNSLGIISPGATQLALAFLTTEVGVIFLSVRDSKCWGRLVGCIRTTRVEASVSSDQGTTLSFSSVLLCQTVMCLLRPPCMHLYLLLRRFEDTRVLENGGIVLEESVVSSRVYLIDTFIN